MKSRRAVLKQVLLLPSAITCLHKLEGAESDKKPRKLTPEEVEKYLNEGKVFFLDVRTPEEVKELGTLPGYVNIPIDELPKRLDEIPKDKLIITA